MHNHKYMKEIYFYIPHQKISLHLKKIPKMSKIWVFQLERKGHNGNSSSSGGL